MLNKLKLNRWIIMIALLLGLYYLFPIQEGIRTKRDVSTKEQKPLTDKVTGYWKPRTERPARRKNS